ncbi:MAG: cyclic pyranopterin monophosphate synthase MoaC [Sphingomonadaceae bacterium]
MPDLTHLDAGGAARMVDVGDKAATKRIAIAEGRIRMNAAARTAIAQGEVPKGDVLAAARIAGILAAKRTSDLIPLCHPLPLDKVTIDCTITADGVQVRAEARTTGRTGVEMEALTATCVALLTIHDMAKAIDKAMVIEGVRLLEKHGGKSGSFHAD